MLNVLVVDDLQVDRLVIKNQLNSAYQVTTLSSAVEAKAFALTHSFDIALLNVMLRSDLDCIDLLKDLEEIAGRKFVAIAITCYIDDLREKRVMNAGFKSIMRKPFDKDVFDDLVQENIDTGERERSLIFRMLTDTTEKLK